MKKVKVAMGTLLIVLATFSFLYLQGCNKQSEKVSDNTTATDNKQASAFTESDADLVNVDYKDFYDKLAPKGEWIKVTPDDLGIKAKTTSDIEHPSKSMLLSEVFGVNSAYAQDPAAGAFFVWQPAPELSLGVSAGAPVTTPVETSTVTTTTTAVAPATPYVPYTNGSWVNTDNGWYFQAATPEEEIVHHYGRWEKSPTLGWVWLPGKVWSPAWVDWKKDDKLMAWAPLPYSTVVVNDAVAPVVIPADRYVTIEQPHFLDPVYTYRYIAPDPIVTVQSMSPLPGIVVVNNNIVDRGPDVVYVEKVTGKKAFLFPINRVTTFSDVRFKDNVIYTYNPTFKTFEKRENLSRPEKVTEFLAAREKYGNKYGDMKKMEKNENERNGDENKQKEMKQKASDNDNRMPVYKTNEKKHDNPVKEKSNGNENKGKEDHEKKSNDGKHEVKDNGNKGNEKHDDKGGEHGKKDK